MRCDLIKLDVLILIAGARRLAKHKKDLLFIIGAPPIFAFIIGSLLNDLLGQHRVILTYAISALVAMVLSKTLLERIFFQQTDGFMAHYALEIRAWLTYLLIFSVIGIVIGFIGSAAINIIHPASAMLGTCTGLVVGLTVLFLREPARQIWSNIVPDTRLDMLRHSDTPYIAAMVPVLVGIICIFLPQQDHFSGVAVGGYGMVVILLTGRLDFGTVRYMTLVGHSSVSLMRNWTPIQLWLLLPFVLVLTFAQIWVAASVAALLVSGLTAITTLRIFAYRAFSRLAADWLVAILILVSGYGTLTFPPLGVAAIATAIVWIAWRGSASRWLLL